MVQFSGKVGLPAAVLQAPLETGQMLCPDAVDASSPQMLCC